ncbi:MAG: FG-GAP-like repeat-containing protein, partial [Silvibacterium sp.]
MIGGANTTKRIVILSGLALLASAIACFAQTRDTKPERLAVHPYSASKSYPGPAWFVNVAPQAGLNMLNVNGDAAAKKYIIETTGSGVAIIDYNRDGWPDILLLNGRTLDGEPSPSPNPTSHLYRNNRDGTFTDVTVEAGLTATGWAQGACVGDYDNDGYDDIYITYYGKNRLYHNQRNGT